MKTRIYRAVSFESHHLGWWHEYDASNPNVTLCGKEIDWKNAVDYRLDRHYYPMNTERLGNAASELPCGWCRVIFDPWPVDYSDDNVPFPMTGGRRLRRRER